MTSTRDSEEGPRKGRRGRLAAGCTVLVLLVAHAARAVEVSDVLARMRRAAEPGRDMRAAIELIMTNAQGERVHWGASSTASVACGPESASFSYPRST
jgi:hypothetical protein